MRSSLVSGVLSAVMLVVPALAAPEPAIPALLKLADQYRVVALGENHWSQAKGSFCQSLVRAPGFEDHFHTVALECGNSRYQATLDRYMNGEEVSYQEISHVWRDTAKAVAWESPIYADLLAAIRDVNRGLPATRKIRVLAADAPIDWSKVADHSDWESALAGNDFFASLIQQEVLEKHQRALAIMGANHVTRGKGWHGETTLTGLLEKHGRHSVYVVLLWGWISKVIPM